MTEEDPRYDGLDLTDQTRAELDAMPPAKRQEWIDYLKAQQSGWDSVRAGAREAVVGLDKINDIMLSQLDLQPDEASRQALVDHVMTNVLMGECLLASARGDAETADTHLQAWQRYAEKTKNQVIVVRDRPGPDVMSVRPTRWEAWP
ncbi:hypothetical protein [Kutzneria sp. CA-103260]|uniref:hypothetical protein n=1 Tax=Kutzneria sp. CA-103260 TaxID=2802641 RepID=UPI001BA8ADAC|nr:hypothetical protein [Kutzneria sp. CA-103260]QUQ68262.1 hypothetical protein JJ691_60070 [Kutzneria sp. CA-103260]